MSTANRRSRRPGFGLALGLAALAALGAADAPETKKPEPIEAEGPAYDELARVVLMPEGGKPLDTVARQEVKAVAGRQTFSPIGPDGKEGPEWGPVSALLGWKNVPDYWDEGRCILAEYLPLRRMLLADRSSRS